MIKSNHGRRIASNCIGLLVAVIFVLAALPSAAAPSSGLYYSTADSLGVSANAVTRASFDHYSTTRIYQGASVNKPYSLALDRGAARAFMVLNDSAGQSVASVDLNSGVTTAMAATAISGAGRSISGLALDRVDGVVYYATASSIAATDNRILRITYDGSALPAVYASSGNDAKPFELAVDHGNARLFIVFSNGSESWISVAGLDGSGLAKLSITSASNSGAAIGGLALDTLNGFLYYTVTGSLAAEDNRIYRVGYDGSSRQLLYSGTDLDKPSFLALDQNNNIYAAYTGNGYQLVKSASLANFPGMSWTQVPSTLIQYPGVSITGIDTLADLPSATTLAATSISASGATLNGTVNANGFSTNVSFDYGTDTGYGSSVTAMPSPVSGASDTAVSASLSGLACNTLYHFRVNVVNSVGTTNGGDLNFTTSACPVSYTLTYDGNGNNAGFVPTDVNSPYLQGTTVTVLGNSGALTKAGYSFSGWNTAADGSGINYPAGATFDINGNTTLYAIWLAPVSQPAGLVSWWRGEGNAIDSVGGNNGAIHNLSAVAENNTATASCSNGAKIVAYTSLYGTNCSAPISCGSCAVGDTSCTVLFSNATCPADPCAGTVKQARLDITCAAPDSTGFASGKVGKALGFDGTGDYVAQGKTYKGTVSSTSSSSFSMEFWARPTATITNMPGAETTSGYAGVSGQRYAVFPEYIESATEAGAGVSVGTNAILVVEHAYDSMPATLVYPIVNDIPADGWLHIAVVYENQTPKLYVNGDLKKTGVSSGKIVYPSSAFGEAGRGYGFYKGALDEVHIINRALSATEIKGIYNSGSSGLDATAAPVVTSISPSSGTTIGGTSVIITGSNFTGDSSIKFGNSTAPSFSFYSNSQVTAISPAGVAGLIADITVTTPAGTSAISSADQFIYTQDQARNITTGTQYASLENALFTALEGAEIRAFDSQFDGVFTLGKGIALKGGFDGAFLTKTGTPTTLNNGLTVAGGDSVVETLVLKGQLVLQGGSLRVNDVTVRP